MTKTRRSKEQIQQDQNKLYELELKFKAFDMYDKIYKANNFELIDTLEIEQKINELNKVNKNIILLDQSYCVNCNKKKDKHLNKYCFEDNDKLTYKPFNKKLIEVNV